MLLLILPFLLMVVVNEVVRPVIKEQPYSKYGITAINSVDKDKDNCTWFCHNNTGFCKENHVTYLVPHFKHTDIVYFGIINLLQKTGNYGLANIIFLVILFPLLIWFFLVKSLNIQDEIKQLKKPK